MSIKVASHVWEHSQQSGSALLMLLALADHANDDGACWPSIETLARKCRVSERQARRLIRKLEDDGELATDVGGGRGNASIYWVLLGKGDMGDRVSEEKGTSGAEKGDMGDTKGDTHDHKRGHSYVPRSVRNHKEPSIDPSGESNGHKDPLTETAVKHLVDWWVSLVGCGNSRNPNGDLYQPAEALLKRLQMDVPEAKDLIEAKRQWMIREKDWMPKWLSGVVPGVIADMDRDKRYPEDDEVLVWDDSFVEEA